MADSYIEDFEEVYDVESLCDLKEMRLCQCAEDMLVSIYELKGLVKATRFDNIRVGHSPLHAYIDDRFDLVVNKLKNAFIKYQAQTIEKEVKVE